MSQNPSCTTTTATNAISPSLSLSTRNPLQPLLLLCCSSYCVPEYEEQKKLAATSKDGGRRQKPTDDDDDNAVRTRGRNETGISFLCDR